MSRRLLFFLFFLWDCLCVSVVWWVCFVKIEHLCFLFHYHTFIWLFSIFPFLCKVRKAKCWLCFLDRLWVGSSFLTFLNEEFVLIELQTHWEIRYWIIVWRLCRCANYCSVYWFELVLVLLIWLVVSRTDVLGKFRVELESFFFLVKTFILPCLRCGKVILDTSCYRSNCCFHMFSFFKKN